MGITDALQNSKVMDKIVSALGIQSAVTKLPVALATTIQPVLDVEPDKIIDVIEGNSATGTIFTTPTDRDFFLTNAGISAASADDNAVTLNSISVTLESGKITSILVLLLATQAVGSDSKSEDLVLPIPIKLKRGTTIDSTLGSDSGRFRIMGYLKDSL